jgi:hypothetical protein
VLESDVDGFGRRPIGKVACGSTWRQESQLGIGGGGLSDLSGQGRMGDARGAAVGLSPVLVSSLGKLDLEGEGAVRVLVETGIDIRNADVEMRVTIGRCWQVSDGQAWPARTCREGLPNPLQVAETASATY